MLTQTPELRHVTKGMEVYDINGNQLGTVQAMHFGDANIEDTTPNINMIQKFLEPLLNDPREFPEVIYNRMYREGFVRVQRGLLRSDLFVFANEIQRIEDQKVYLSIPEDEIMEG